MFFTEWRQLPSSTDYMDASGWVWRGIVPWCKPNARPQLGRFTAQGEYVIWGTAGTMPADPSADTIPGFYECTAPRDRVHVTQKLLPLMRELLRIVPPGAVVLDPFMGATSTGVACLQTGRRFVGIELYPAHFANACERIGEARTARARYSIMRTRRGNRHVWRSNRKAPPKRDSIWAYLIALLFGATRGSLQRRSHPPSQMGTKVTAI
ncbi:Methyltransferase (modular protein) [Paraburkholderia sacchari]|uniref:DNA methyltransferase n=1 Tax=Paraburkholderia sacchari TaxID=159450 RepID=UPI0039A5A5E5